MSIFTWPVRVYFEDTDAGGIVYHAQYLNFMERARTEWFRHQDFQQNQLFKQNVQLVVSRLSCRYIRPAVLDDLLEIRNSIIEVAYCTLLFKQEVYRGDELLCDGEVEIACIDAVNLKPKRWPSKMKTLLNEQLVACPGE